MDTNQQQNRADNYQINTFSKGMNTDTSYDMVGAEQYVFGQNIRITNNVLIDNKIDHNAKEGIVTPIGIGESKHIDIEGSIMASATIENVGAIITKLDNGHWKVYRIDCKDDQLFSTPVFTSTQTTTRDKFSVVINKELEGYTKLYIADSVNKIMCINLDDVDYYANATEDWLMSNHIYPKQQIKIVKKISGQLKTQQVQYVYRFYKKYGICSKLSPISPKLQIIDDNRKKETGNAEDTVTSIGLQLSIDTSEYIHIFDHVQVFRLSYITAGQNAEINLIYDAKITENKFNLNDTGIQSLAQYSMDEFSAMSGQTIKPTLIEQNQHYMFAANITDDSIFRVEQKDYNPRSYRFDNSGKTLVCSDTLYNDYKEFSRQDILENKIEDKYYLSEYSDINSSSQSTYLYNKSGSVDVLGGEGPNISWKFVTCEIQIDSSEDGAPVNQKTVNNGQLFYITSAGMTQFSDTDAYYKSRNIFLDSDISYDDIVTSSMMRSLKRDEVYRYGIVFYDDHGVHSDVLWIADIKTPTVEQFDIILKNGEYVYALPIGIQFEVKNYPVVKDHNIVSYQIVRCQKSETYTKNLLQVALSRPMRQGKYNQDTYRTPYYPNVFLSTQFFYTAYGYTLEDHRSGNNGGAIITSDLWKSYYDKNGTNVENDTLYQAFSPYINIAREDALSMLSQSNIKLTPLYYTTVNYGTAELSDKIGNADAIVEYSGRYGSWGSSISNDQFLHSLNDIVYLSCKYKQPWRKSDKISQNLLIKPYFHLFDCSNSDSNKLNFNSVDIKHIGDVKNPTWEEGFTDVQLSGSDIIGAIKQYKSFTTNVGTQNYVNWVCNGMYDLPTCANEVSVTSGNDSVWRRVFIDSNDGLEDEGQRNRQAYGWIGPGPVCFLLNTDHPDSTSVFTNHIINSNKTSACMGTIVANIQHTAVQFAGLTSEEKQYDVYYGFGNFSNTNNLIVFDGDVYITPAEFVNMFKTYNFNDIESTIPSGQVVYYIPIESNINTFFDYGMNYRNSGSNNLQLEPGIINGVTSQDRPLHQYNMIYSDNNTSNDLFVPQSVEQITETFKQRIYYSQLKQDGESIDNWHIFKPAQFIDVDTRYGELTYLMKVYEQLYYWQNSAFGRLSVNERSLVTDDSGNTVQLGQAGVLQRTDYLDTRYGMVEQDMSAVNNDGSIYWIDRNNRSIVSRVKASSYTNKEVTLDMCESANVMNLCNTMFDNRRPDISVDTQNLELLCNCLKDDKQLVFNLKLGVATSVYTRDYSDTITFNNKLFGIKENTYQMLNYNKDVYKYLPTKLEFIVSSSPSQTKVFDNQKIVSMNCKDATQFMVNKLFTFDTDISENNTNNVQAVTDREGNICYCIPRHGNSNFGNRMRGKWLKVKIEDNDAKYDFAISHIITKFRQSYS